MCDVFRGALCRQIQDVPKVLQHFRVWLLRVCLHFCVRILFVILILEMLYFVIIGLVFQHKMINEEIRSAIDAMQKREIPNPEVVKILYLKHYEVKRIVDRFKATE